MLPVTIILAIVILLLWLFNKLSKPPHFPPGPFVFPVLGVLPHFLLGGTLLKKLEDWRQNYGDILSVSFGSNRALILHGVNLIKEAYTMEEFSGRPLLAPMRVIATEKRRGLVFAEGTHWEAQRRFALRHLRDFGFGKRSSEQATYEDIVDLIAKFKKELGQPISTSQRFNMSVVSSLWNIITGQRYDIDDPEFQNVLKVINAAISTGASNATAFAMDWATGLAPELTGWNTFKNSVKLAKEFVKKQIDYHKKTFQPGDFRDFMDVYVNEMERTKDQNSSFFKDAGDENLLVGTLNLLAAGAETTSSTLTWALLFLSRNPSVQTTLQGEIDNVVGHSRFPSLADQEMMPFTMATILETLRKSSLAPLGFPHSTMTDFQFHGYSIPKNTIIFANLFDIHHNRGTWGDPETFRPARFLNPDDGTLLKTHPPVIPFSTGRRQCLGETLARNNIFLFLVSLFQAFDVKKVTGKDEKAEINEPFGLIRFPPDFKVVFEDRLLT